MKRRRHRLGAIWPRLSRRHEFWLYVSSAALLLSGLGWLCSHFLLRGSSPFGAIANPAEAWWMRLHGAAVIVFLIAFGALLPGHVVQNWGTRLHRGTGGSNVALIVLLALSGYGLYYVVSDQAHTWISVLHWSIGLLWLAALVVHVVLGKRRVASLHAHRLHTGQFDRALERPVRASLHR
jgi:hypothetical protein